MSENFPNMSPATADADLHSTFHVSAETIVIPVSCVAGFKSHGHFTLPSQFDLNLDNSLR